MEKSVTSTEKLAKIAAMLKKDSGSIKVTTHYVRQCYRKMKIKKKIIRIKKKVVTMAVAVEASKDEAITKLIFDAKS